MLVKATILFLLGMVLVGMVGRWMFPTAMKRMIRLPGDCAGCGRPRIGKGPCACGKGPRA